MAVVTTYSFTEGTPFYIPSASADNTLFDIDLTSLSNGGFAGAGFHSYFGHTDGQVYDATLAGIGSLSILNYGASPTALAQLDNTNIVNTAISGGNVVFSINSTNGTSVVSSTGLGLTGVLNADVAALKGIDAGFAIAIDKVFSATDHDIHVFLRNEDGSANGAGIPVDTSVATLDDKPSVAVLTGGNIAVAWTRTDSLGNTSTRYAVLNSSGGTVKSSSNLDSSGTINQNVNVVGLADGGFAVVYEDNSSGNSEIVLAKFDSSGNAAGTVNVTLSNETSTDPYATLLSNGYVAVSFTEDFTSDHDVQTQVIDVANMLRVGGAQNMDTSLFDDSTSSAAAATNNGKLVVSWNESGIGNQVQELTFIRTTIGDGQSNTLNGDGLIDHMDGGKRNDELSGAGSDDVLTGGKGKDTLIGGAGADTLYGGTGKNTASYAGATGGLSARLNDPGSNTGDADGDTYTNIQNLTGTVFGDLLVGDGNNNTLEGGGLDDVLVGNGGKDVLKGTSGFDTLYGGAGADTLDGGAFSDFYNFLAASDSTGQNYDTITSFNGNQDGFGLTVSVTGIDSTVASGTLNTMGFNANLAAAVGAGQLGAHHAVLFTPDAGTLAGHTFLIIDHNNTAGYQANQDLVMDLVSPSQLGGLSTSDFVILLGIDPGDIGPIEAGADTHDPVADHRISSSVIDHFMDRLAGAHDHFGSGHFLV